MVTRTRLNVAFILCTFPVSLNIAKTGAVDAQEPLAQNDFSNINRIGFVKRRTFRVT